jgi:hypothetical protein
MQTEQPKQEEIPKKSFFQELRMTLVPVGILIFTAGAVYVINTLHMPLIQYERPIEQEAEAKTEPAPPPPWPLSLDTKAYNKRMLSLAHYIAPKISTTTASSTSGSTTPPIAAAPLPTATASTSISVSGALWPTPAVYPDGGAILPFKRIVAYYGNFYSTKMGVLGEYPREEVLQKLASTTKLWEEADPTTPAIPAIQYIAVVAQGSAGPGGKYILRMPDEEIDKALSMANELHGLLFLDIQIGKSTLQAELPYLVKYLKMPNVHLAIDPEFSMKYGNPPGTVIGTYDASDINYAASFLADLVKKYKLPPKVLVVHRFTQDMVTGYKDIKPLPEVEIVMDMDGWGSPAKKKGTYYRVINPEPVQFTGIKLFYYNDLRPPSTRMMTLREVLDLTPAPVYIQYQ